MTGWSLEALESLALERDSLEGLLERAADLRGQSMDQISHLLARTLSETRALHSSFDGSGSGEPDCCGPSSSVARVVVDVTATYLSGSLTGIQRVVRKTVEAWLGGNRKIELAVFDRQTSAYRELPGASFLAEAGKQSGDDQQRRTRSLGLHQRVDLKDGVLVILELPDSYERIDCLTSLVESKIPRAVVSMVYDLIPPALPWTAGAGMPEFFMHYLKWVAHTEVAWTISETTAQKLGTFLEVVESSKNTTVMPMPLPAEGIAALAPESRRPSGRKGLVFRHSERTIKVLMVGSVEPRKNHLSGVLAVERLWRRGERLELIIAAGRTWNSELTLKVIHDLQRRGRPLEVVVRPSDSKLASIYRESGVVLFPSFGEGFGLPVTEALSAGCAVVTSDRGATAEFGCDPLFIVLGGQMVDPDSISSIEDGLARAIQIRKGLDGAQAPLEPCVTARGRSLPLGWSEYSNQLWESLEMVAPIQSGGQVP